MADQRISTRKLNLAITHSLYNQTRELECFQRPQIWPLAWCFLITSTKAFIYLLKTNEKTCFPLCTPMLRSQPIVVLCCSYADNAVRSEECLVCHYGKRRYREQAVQVSLKTLFPAWPNGELFSTRQTPCPMIAQLFALWTIDFDGFDWLTANY